jgi:Predicted restriction endonuclease
MRLVKLSTIEFEDENVLQRYFSEELHNREPKGLFVFGRQIAANGIEPGETILFSYRSKLRYVGKAKTGRTDNSHPDYPEYSHCFVIKLPVREANVSLEEVERKLRAEASLQKSLAGQGWTKIPDSERAEKVIEDLLFADAHTPSANDVPDGLPAKIKRTADKVLKGKRSKPPADYTPTADERLLEQRVSKLRKKEITTKPKGQAKPATVPTTGRAYVRDPLVKAWVLQKANGRCEGCGKPAPFTGDDGEPFLESHHVRTLADGGSDKITNAVVLCPNCHRRSHQGADRKDFKASLYAKIPRLVRE